MNASQPMAHRRWGSLCLLFAMSILCLKWTPLSWMWSVIPLVGYFGASQWGKRGLSLSALLLSALGAYALYQGQQLFFLLLFVAIVFSSYLLVYLEQQQQIENLTLHQEKEAAAEMQIQGLQRSVLELKKRQTETEHQKRLLEVELNEFFSINEKTKQALQEALFEKEQALAQMRDWESAYEALLAQQSEELLTQSLADLAAARQEVEGLQNRLYLLENAREEDRQEALKEVLTLSRTIQAASLQCEMLEAHSVSLQELVTLLIPFGKTQLRK